MWWGVCILGCVDCTTMWCGVWCVYTRMRGLHHYLMWCVVCVYWDGWTAPLCDVVCDVCILEWVDCTTMWCGVQCVCVLGWVDCTTMCCGVRCVYTRMSGLHHYVMWCAVCVGTRMGGLHHYVMWCVMCVYYDEWTEPLCDVLWGV